MTSREIDPMLRQIERQAVTICLSTAVIALLARGGRPDVALGVLGGGALIGVSYWAIKAAIDGLIGAIAQGSTTAVEGAVSAVADMGAEGRSVGARRGASRFRLAWLLVQFVGRYAVLGLMAYVMMAHLRLHPIGLLAGVSSVVGAVAIEALRGGLWPHANPKRGGQG